MLYIVEKSTGKIVEKFEAWMPKLFDEVGRYCTVYGWKWIGEPEITFMGDMIVYVEDALI